MSPLDDDDDITESTRKKMLWFYSLRTALRTALCESIRYQAKSEQNVRQDLIPWVRHGEAALCSPNPCLNLVSNTTVCHDKDQRLSNIQIL